MQARLWHPQGVDGWARTVSRRLGLLSQRSSMHVSAIPDVSSQGAPAASTALQQLYQRARGCLSPTALPSPEQLEELRRLASAVTLPELGFPQEVLRDPSLVDSHLQRTEQHHPFLRGYVTYLDIYDCPAFSLGIFCLPKGTRIPLHDHPGMSVISHLLFGSMHVKAYDALPSASFQLSEPMSQQCDALRTGGQLDRLHDAYGSGMDNGMNGESARNSWGRVASMAASVRERLWGAGTQAPQWQYPDAHFQAQLKLDTVITAPTSTLLLQPDSCNIHEFTALQHCAVLDLLTPPYNERQGRDCTYFREVAGHHKGSGAPHRTNACAAPGAARVGDIMTLEVVETEFYTKSGPYRGVRVH